MTPITIYGAGAGVDEPSKVQLAEAIGLGTRDLWQIELVGMPI